MIDIEYASRDVNDALNRAWEMAVHCRDEFFTPEHMLWGIGWQRSYLLVASTPTQRAMYDYLNLYTTHVPEEIDGYTGPTPSELFHVMIEMAQKLREASEAKKLEVPHIIDAMMHLEGSYAQKVLEAVAGDDPASFLSEIVNEYTLDSDNFPYSDADLDAYDKEMEGMRAGTLDLFGEPAEWTKYTTCISDNLSSHNPLIGRNEELRRTIQVLCRKDKNNPILVGEPGVGKTAMAYGLAQMIEQGNVPPRLKGTKIYEADLGAMIAGTQFRGDFEKRIKYVLEGVAAQGKSILFFDEIHNIIGAGKVEGGTLDASNMLKPYLEKGDIRFMGATTYDEYKRTFTHSKAFARRFEKIDIDEPSIEESIEILQGLKHKYEDYHGVRFTDEAIRYAVEASAKYINGKFLPDKAIDLIDEAGAWMQIITTDDKQSIVDKKIISEVLSKVCKVESLSEDRNGNDDMENITERMRSVIFGQDKAIEEVCMAVQMARAGLSDDDKPMASLLFVGPTGVGKTEVARQLAKQLSMPLLRFDMSEYAEKHTVAKLIGSPAGYVGYEDGGLLTDAIRKTPHCVLLFDELEKAHQDIYNILLQVMDYAVLTDNRGEKADFRHVVFIMTTNAGAQYSHSANVGFTKSQSAGQAMMKAVKQTFKPEFLNRLTSITVFNDMNGDMAERILHKKLSELHRKLAVKGVKMSLTPEAEKLMIKEGFSSEYGGREIDRVINSKLKPMLMRAILFGNLKNGGEAIVDAQDNNLIIK